MAVRWRALVIAALAVVATGCDRDEQSQSPTTQVVVALVRDAAAQVPPSDDPDTLPVVYVVSSADDGVAPKTQAANSRPLPKKTVAKKRSSRSPNRSRTTAMNHRKAMPAMGMQ